MTPQQIEAMKLALEALLYLKKPIANGWDAGAQKEAQDKAITALEEALAQPEQEPVTFEEWLSKQHGDPEEIGFLQALRIAYISGQDSITIPPQRTWVGLTDEEIGTIAYNVNPLDGIRQFSRAVEAKLKEKNT